MTSAARTSDVTLSECMVLLLLEEELEAERSERRRLEHLVSDEVNGSAEEDREPSSISGIAAQHDFLLAFFFFFLVLDFLALSKLELLFVLLEVCSSPRHFVRPRRLSLSLSVHLCADVSLILLLLSGSEALANSVGGSI